MFGSEGWESTEEQQWFTQLAKNNFFFWEKTKNMVNNLTANQDT